MGRTVHRTSQRGNRQLNHALHMAAICQMRHPGSAGRVYVDRKVAEGKTKREAIRALKRHLSNVVYRQLVSDAQRRTGFNPRAREDTKKRLNSQRGQLSFLHTGSSAKSPPDPKPTLRPPPTPGPPRAPCNRVKRPLDTERIRRGHTTTPTMPSRMGNVIRTVLLASVGPGSVVEPCTKEDPSSNPSIGIEVDPAQTLDPITSVRPGRRRRGVMDGCRVGVGRSEITPNRSGPVCGWGVTYGEKHALPPQGRWLESTGGDEPPSLEHQDLVATAMALEDARGDRVVFVNADLHSGGAHLWRAAAAAAGLDPSRVVLCGTHTHAGPGQRYGSFMYAHLATASPLFNVRKPTSVIQSALTAAVRQAVAGLAPGGVAVRRAAVIGAGSNRAAAAWCHYDDEEIARFFTSGPGAALHDQPHRADRMRDPRVTALTAFNDDGAVVGVLAWFAVHGNSLGQTWQRFGSDLWGPARATAERELGGAVVGLGCGSAGDVSPRPMDEQGRPRTGDPSASRPDVTVDVGQRVGTAVASAVRDAQPSGFVLGAAHEQWKPARDGLPSPMLGLAQAGGGVDGTTPNWEQVEAGVHAPLYRRRQSWAYPPGHGQSPKLALAALILPVKLRLGFLFRWLLPKRVPLHVIRVGDHAFATVPGEPTTITGWRIEERVRSAAGTSSASVIGYAGDYAGYWVTPEEYLEQRYEAAATLFGREASTYLIGRLETLARSLTTSDVR